MKVRKIAMPVPFDKKTVKYKRLDHDGRKDMHGSTNPETWAFMKNRYVVFRKFIDKDIIDMVMDMWRSVEQHPNPGDLLKHETKDITYKNPESSIGKSKGGYCTPWGNALHNWVHKKLDDHFDMDLGMTYSYSRKYDRGAYLGTHVDRPSCEVSATLCLDYVTDDETPWPIWVKNDGNYLCAEAEKIKNESQDLSQRQRLKNGCKKVLLEPGDLLMYQGPNIPHWRDYLLGDYSYHIFLHWYNRQSGMMQLNNWFSTKDANLPTHTMRGALELDGRQNQYSSNNGDPEFNQDFENFTEFYNQSLASARLGQNPDFERTANYFDMFEEVEVREKK